MIGKQKLRNFLGGMGKSLAIEGVSSGLDFLFNRLTAGAQMQDQKDLIDYEYAKQMDAWHKQNEYNSPAQQIARLRAAGLNPALMNGNSFVNSAGGLSSVGSPSAPSGVTRQSRLAQGVQILDGLLTADKQRGFLTEQTRKFAEEVLNLKLERDIKDIARLMGLTEYEIRQLDKEAMYEAYYGESIYGGAPTIKNNPISLQMEEARSRIVNQDANARLSEELAITESSLRDLRGEQLSQNIAESKQRVKTLSAESKKLLREADSIEQIYNRRDLQDCASSFFGFQVHDLPATLQQRVMMLYTSVVRGEIYPETAIRSVERAIDEYREKELHIPRTRSESGNQSQSSLYGLRSNSNGYSWSETF